MKEEKVPRFHIFAQVDYSGLFPALLLVCLLQSNLCRHTHIHMNQATHKLTHSSVYAKFVPSERAFLLIAAYFILCHPFAPHFPQLCAMNMR